MPESHPFCLHPTPPVKKALSRIRASLTARNLDACLISRPENRFYLSGYTAHDTAIDESSGMLLVLRKAPAVLLTDSRFTLHAKKEVGPHGICVQVYQRGVLELLPDLFSRFAIKKIGFESRYTLHSFATALLELCKKHRVKAVFFDTVCERFRLAKTGHEIAAMEQALQVAETALQEVVQTLAPGVRECDIALQLENAMRRLGAEGPSFPTIVASGPNGAMPHAVPGSRAVARGEPIIIDMGARLGGYCSDITRTVFLGEPDSTTRTRVRLVRRAQQAAIQAIRPGIPCSLPDTVARDVLKTENLDGYFTHSLGHGVGIAVHEAPSLNRRARKHFSPGMVVTVEPGIYIPGWGGIRLENTIVVTEEGNRILNRDTSFLDI